MGVKVRGAVFIPVLSPPPNIPRTRTRIAQDAPKGGMVAGKKGWMENPYQWERVRLV